MIGLRRKATPAGGPEAAPRLVLDLDTFRLDGTRCGDPADGLAALGPGTPGVGRWEREYPAHGLTVEVRRGRVRAVHAHVRPTAAEEATGMHPFAGTVRHRGAAVEPDRITSEAAAVARFGEPDVVGATDDGYALTYDADGVGWELLLSPDGRLATVSVYARG